MNELRYANNENGELIHISKVNKENRNNTKYYCIGCESELIARLGEINEHHFCHKNKGECNGETYLHKTAKQVFYNRYIQSLENKVPVNVNYKALNKCNINIHCVKELENSFDLTTHFDLIKMEKKEGKFIPDILLYSSKSDQKIFIEMKVTHGLSEEKKNSGYRIIEYTITENDIEKDFEFSNYKLYNFKKIDTNKCTCDLNRPIFLIDKNNNIHFDRVKVLSFNPENWKYSEFLRENLLKESVIYNRQKFKKIDVKHCILCKFSKLTSKGDLYCNIKKTKMYYHECMDIPKNCKSFFCDTSKDFEQKYMSYGKRPYDDSYWDD